MYAPSRDRFERPFLFTPLHYIYSHIAYAPLKMYDAAGTPGLE